MQIAPLQIRKFVRRLPGSLPTSTLPAKARPSVKARQGAFCLRPGDFVTVSVTEPELRSVALVPSTAIGANETALVLDEDNRLSEVAVDLLRRQGDDVIIRAPALYGQRIVAERSPLLGAGIAVQPIDLNTKAVVPQAPEMVTLDATRRAKMIAFVEASRMPAPVKTRLIDQLEQDGVPSTVIARLEERMGT